MKSNTQYVNIECTINEIYAITKVSQNIINPFNKNVELEVELPTLENNQLVKFTAIVGNQKVVSKISAKEKAKEKYTDSIASGNIGIYSTKSEDDEKQIVYIGNLSKKQSAILESEFVQMISSEDMSCQFLLIQQYPQFIFKESSSNTLSTCVFHACINLSVQGKLTRLIINKNDFPGEVNKKYNETNSNVIITIHNDKYIPTKQSSKTMQILFRSDSINKPKLYSQYNPTFNETSYLLSYLHSSNKINIPLLSQIDEDVNSNYIIKYQNDIINNYPGLFIFLVDQSGSMSGSAIKIVANALKIFFHSLPRNSYFQLIGFGSSFRKYNEKPLPYTSDNVNKVMDVINNLKADLGGTNLINPLRNVLIECVQHYKDIHLQKSIFVLTDGDIFDKKECFDLIENNLNDFKIYSIGIGSSFDRDLIEQLGKRGNGSSHFVPDTTEINKIIIEILNKCIRDYLIKGKFIMNKEFPIQYEYPNEYKLICQDDIITYAFICKGKCNINKTKISFTATNPKTNDIIHEDIDIDNIDELKEGDIISKIVIGKYVNSDDINEKEEISLAKKYQILSKNTALSGEIINASNNTSKEIETFKLIKPKIQHNSNNIDIIQYDDNVSSKNNFFSGVGTFFKNMFSGTKRNKKDIEYESCFAPIEDVYLDEGVDCCAPLDDDFVAPLGKCYDECDEDDGFDDECPYPVSSKSVSSETKEGDDHFQNLMLSQDVIEGFWNDNSETKKIVNELKDVYDKIRMIIEKENVDKDIQEKVIFTFLVLYYINEFKKEKISEVMLIINKGKEFLEMSKFKYDILVEKIK